MVKLSNIDYSEVGLDLSTDGDYTTYTKIVLGQEVLSQIKDFIKEERAKLLSTSLAWSQEERRLLNRLAALVRKLERI